MARRHVECDRTRTHTQFGSLCRVPVGLFSGASLGSVYSVRCVYKPIPLIPLSPLSFLAALSHTNTAMRNDTQAKQSREKRYATLATAIATACMLGYRWYASRRANSASQTRVDPPADELELELEADIVAFSSRLIAAERAIEAERPDATRLCYDPIAALLAGPRAIERVKANNGGNGIGNGGAPPANAPTAGASGGQPDGTHTINTPTHPRPRIPIRTRFFDEWFNRIGRRADEPATSVPMTTNSDACRNPPPAILQSVILGAGMDARVFRLDCFRRTGCTVYELDQPGVVRVKNRLLTAGLARGDIQPPLCKRVAVECDFANNQPGDARHWTAALADAGYDRNAPGCFLMEGLLMYLDEEEQMQLIRDISAVASKGSQLALSHVNQQALRNAGRSASATSTTAPYAPSTQPSRDPSNSSAMTGISPAYRSLFSAWKSYLSHGFLASLDAHGWSIRTLTQLGAPDANYGAWSRPVYPISDETRGRVLYLLAEKIR